MLSYLDFISTTSPAGTLLYALALKGLCAHGTAGRVAPSTTAHARCRAPDSRGSACRYSMRRLLSLVQTACGALQRACERHAVSHAIPRPCQRLAIAVLHALFHLLLNNSAVTPSPTRRTPGATSAAAWLARYFYQDSLPYLSPRARSPSPSWALAGGKTSRVTYRAWRASPFRLPLAKPLHRLALPSHGGTGLDALRALHTVLVTWTHSNRRSLVHCGLHTTNRTPANMAYTTKQPPTLSPFPHCHTTPLSTHCNSSIHSRPPVATYKHALPNTHLPPLVYWHMTTTNPGRTTHMPGLSILCLSCGFSCIGVNISGTRNSPGTRAVALRYVKASKFFLRCINRFGRLPTYFYSRLPQILPTAARRRAPTRRSIYRRLSTCCGFLPT